jgi:CheY-like chemotaxis protein
MSLEPQTLHTNGKRVLCIEDEHFISELYARALGRRGYDVDIELDGQRGLTKAQTNNYDIVLIDLMVPTIDGIEILRTLRDPAKTPQLKAKLIVITNLEQREDIRSDIEKQADGYLVKAELTPSELVDILDKLKFK